MPLDLRPVRSAADRRAFVRLPAQLLGTNNGWFGQLWRDELKRIDPRLDIVMPGPNGFQATRQLSRGPETKHIPVIIVTAKNQQANQIWCERQGARAYLVKPIDEKQLVTAIDEVVA